MTTLLDRITKALSGWLKRSLPQRVTGCAPDPFTQCECNNYDQYVCRDCHHSGPTCGVVCGNWGNPIRSC
jgi:hypothetical protein